MLPPDGICVGLALKVMLGVGAGGGGTPPPPSGGSSGSSSAITLMGENAPRIAIAKTPTRHHKMKRFIRFEYIIMPTACQQTDNNSVRVAHPYRSLAGLTGTYAWMVLFIYRSR